MENRSRGQGRRVQQRGLGWQDAFVALLRRTTRSVEITHAGRAFYREAAEVLARVEAAGKHAQNAALGIVGHRRVAFVASVATSELGRRMLVNLLLREASTADLIAMLGHGEIDVGRLRISRSIEGRTHQVQPDELAARAGFSADELASEEVAQEGPASTGGAFHPRTEVQHLREA